MSKVEGEGVGALLAHGGRLRLPAEAAERLLARCRIDGDGGLATDAVAIRVVGVGKGEDVCFVDCLDKAKAEHRLGDARRKRRRRVEIAICETSDGISWAAQRDDLTSGKRYRLLGIVDHHAALGLEAGYGEILELPAIDRVRQAHLAQIFQRRLVLRRPGRTGESQEHRCRLGGAFRRMATAVLDVAGLAGARIVERPEPVGGLGGGG
jgi:hypothetical protein